jgi:hypothetical protein
MRMIQRMSVLSMLGLLLAAAMSISVAAAGTPGVGKACDRPEVAACGKCGDGFCAKQCGETAENCPKDCGVVDAAQLLACGKCGDGHCTPQCGETAESCPKDCGVDSATATAGRLD